VALETSILAHYVARQHGLRITLWYLQVFSWQNSRFSHWELGVDRQ
jgi:hypothetical protein